MTTRDETLSGRFLKNTYQWIDRASPVLTPLFIFGVARWLLDVSAQVHWIVGLLTLVPMALLVFSLVLGLRRKLYAKFEGLVVVGLFLMTSLLAMAVFAAASALVYANDPTSYSSLLQMTPGRFADFYGYVLLDAIPGLQIWDTFQIAPPVTYQGHLPALLLLLFRGAIVMQLAVALKEWIDTPATDPTS